MKRGNFSEIDVQLFNQALKGNILKYGFKRSNSAILLAYRTNDFRGFTRDSGIRNMVEQLGSDRIRDIIDWKYAEFSNLDAIFLEKSFHYLVQLINCDIDLRKKMEYYIAACSANISKYRQSNQPFYAINSFISKGDFSAFTRNFNARKNLKENVSEFDGKFLTIAYLSSFHNFFSEYNYDYLLNLDNDGLTNELVSFLKKQMNIEDGNSKRKVGR